MLGLALCGVASAHAPDGSDDGTGLVALASVLLDDRRPVAERVAAAEALGATADPRAVGLLRGGAHTRIPALQRAVLDAATPFRDADAAALAAWLAHDPATAREVRLAALDSLGAMEIDAAGEALWQLAGDRDVADFVQTRARRDLERLYPGVLARLGPPDVVSDPLGAGAGILANGFAGGMMLGSVGHFGKFEGGEAIGGVGGAMIGLGTGALYVRSRPVSQGEGLAYASGVGWGFTAGYLGAQAGLGNPRWRTFDDVSARAREWDGTVASWALGTLGGSVAGGLAARRDPDPWDVLEVDTAAYLGSAFALSAIDLTYRPDLASRRAWNACVERRSYPYAPTVDPCASLEADWYDASRQRSRARAGTTLGGAIAGGVTGALLAREWELGVDDGAFAGVVGAEAAWVGYYWPDAVGIDDTELSGTVRLPLHAAVASALAYAEWRPVPVRTSAVGAYGGTVGNALGAGTAMLLRADDPELARVMIPLGVAGTAGGMLATDALDPTGEDWVMMAVGVPIAAAESAAFAGWLQERSAIDEQQAGGVTLTGTAVTAAALLAASPVADVPADRSVFVGTTALWGAYYGTLTPIAVAPHRDDTDLLLTSSLTADAFLLGGIALAGPGGVHPRDTVIPQVGGITGATLGALGAGMFSGDEEAVAAGAVVGGVVGTGAGAVIEWRTPDRERVGVTPRLRLPGRWTPTVAPAVFDDGRQGVIVGVAATGW